MAKGRKKSAARKGGEAAGKASTFCAGKKGSAFHSCRTRYFKKQRKKRR